jgi:hypothetical protein
VFNLEPDKFTELPEPEDCGYKKLLESFANKCLNQVKSEALALDVSCDVMYV